MTELEYLANCEKAKINLEQLGIKLYHPANENYTTVNKIDGENLIINFKKDTAPYKNMRVLNEMFIKPCGNIHLKCMRALHIRLQILTHLLSEWNLIIAKKSDLGIGFYRTST